MLKTVGLSANITAPGFSKSAIRSLCANAPPRQVPPLDRTEAVQYAGDLVSSLQKLLQGQKLSTIDEILQFSLKLSARKPNIVVRSHLQLLQHGDEGSFFGQDSLESLIKHSMIAFCGSSGAIFEDPMYLHSTKNLLQQLSKTVALVFRAINLNPARRFIHIPLLLDDWAVLQHESWTIDEDCFKRIIATEGDIFKTRPALACPYQFALYSWVAEWSSFLLSSYLMLGTSYKRSFVSSLFVSSRSFPRHILSL
jgi:hypothetical protein